MSDLIVFLFNYFDGPISGITEHEGGLAYFDAKFREDLDSYDSVFSILPLTEEETVLARQIIDERLAISPAVGSLHKGLERRLSSQPDAAIRRLAKIERIRPPGLGHHGGEFTVRWEPAP